MKKRLITFIVLVAMCITAIPMFSLEAEAADIKVGLNTSSNDVSGSEVTSHADIAQNWIKFLQVT
ncbi:MAG: hypothetical protein J6L85_04800 [Clostridia bacterium]|nr:hypothetical protein [Clostridia bacterium]